MNTVQSKHTYTFMYSGFSINVQTYAQVALSLLMVTQKYCNTVKSLLSGQVGPGGAHN